jgi:hypothetical protein
MYGRRQMRTGPNSPAAHTSVAARLFWSASNRDRAVYTSEICKQLKRYPPDELNELLSSLCDRPEWRYQADLLLGSASFDSETHAPVDPFKPQTVEEAFECILFALMKRACKDGRSKLLKGVKQFVVALNPEYSRNHATVISKAVTKRIDKHLTAMASVGEPSYKNFVDANRDVWLGTTGRELAAGLDSEHRDAIVSEMLQISPTVRSRHDERSWALACAEFLNRIVVVSSLHEQLKASNSLV